MPRPLRPALVHGTYHITAHGVAEEEVFRDDADRARYLSLLQDHARSGGVRILAYVLMSNHVHLVLATTETNLSSFIQRVHGIYGARFNRKYSRKGHLFGSRFFSDPVKTDEHLLATTRYIHRNPVKAHMVERPEQYPWSSFRAYLGVESDGFVDTGPVLACLAADQSAATRAYNSFVMETPDLAGLLRAVADGHRGVSDLVKGVADLLNLEPTAIEHRTRGSPARHLSVLLLHRELGWGPHRIAKGMGLSPVKVDRILATDGQRDGLRQSLQGVIDELLRSPGKGHRAGG